MIGMHDMPQYGKNHDTSNGLFFVRNTMPGMSRNQTGKPLEERISTNEISNNIIRIFMITTHMLIHTQWELRINQITIFKLWLSLPELQLLWDLSIEKNEGPDWYHKMCKHVKSKNYNSDNVPELHQVKSTWLTLTKDNSTI